MTKDEKQSQQSLDETQENIESILKTGTFRMYLGSTPPEEAIKHFKGIYGYEPKLCTKVHRELWVGPILDK